MEEDGVLKYRFYYYLSMAGPPDQETTAIEKIACYIHRSQEEGTFYVVGYTEKHQDLW